MLIQPRLKHFFSEEERELAEVILKFEVCGFPLSLYRVRLLAFQYAHINCIKGFSTKNTYSGVHSIYPVNFEAIPTSKMAPSYVTDVFRLDNSKMCWKIITCITFEEFMPQIIVRFLTIPNPAITMVSSVSKRRGSTVSAEASSSAGINSTHHIFSVLQATMFSLKKTQLLSALRDEQFQ